MQLRQHVFTMPAKPGVVAQTQGRMLMTITAMQRIGMIGLAAAVAAVLAGACYAQGQGAAAPDLSGTYQCQPDPSPCLWPGQSPSITANGKQLVIKGDKDNIANAALTSDTTIAAAGTFNSNGIVRPDHTIEWSDGTKWRKQ
jgi:hypothetical protein